MNSRARLKELLNELFRIESSDLDFGIYRIMNKKREEINNFIENNLDKYIDKALMSLSETKKKELEEKLQRIKEGLDIFGVSDYSVSDDYKNVIKELEKYDSTNSIDEIDIYEHIYNFFKRYYDDGDFISQMRYSKENKYVVPYNGEEVYLYWANRDQYYVKTSENFIKYSFGKKSKGIRVEFKINNAELNKNNIKSDEKRYFILHKDFFEYKKEEKLLNIYFEYRALTEDEKKKYKKQNTQNDINKYIFEEIKAAVRKDDLVDLSWMFEKSINSNKTVLEKHIYKYTKKNKSDYFIHKDLKGFLNRELDFYIKNEIVDLNTINIEKIGDVKKLFIKINIFRDICQKIITFLDSIENFQKKLFEKKKFVLQTEYCLTLDKVPQNIKSDIFEAVLSNERQLKEWKDLYDEKITSLDDLYYVDENFEGKKKLKQLMIDTKFFDEDFKEKLLTSFYNLDEQIDGLLIHSENYQGLKFLESKYKEKIDCIYIDPPYNTDASEIIYKNGYKDSSWMTLMENRITIARRLLMPDGLFISAIDDYEYMNLLGLKKLIFGKENYLGTIISHCNPQGRGKKVLDPVSEYHILFSKNAELINDLSVEKPDKKIKKTQFKRTGTNSLKHERPYRFYPMLEKDGKLHMITYDEYLKIYSLNKAFDEEYIRKLTRKYKEKGYNVIFPQREDGQFLVWQREFKRAQKEYSTYIYENGNIYTPGYERRTPTTLWLESKYSNPEYGTELLKDMFGEKGIFDYPKSIYTLEDMIGLKENRLILDFFAGSGTTGHAAININRNNKSENNEYSMKYILIEMGDYIDIVTKQRLKKAVFSDKWKDGKPQNYNGVSHMFKYIRLEQYEDSLRNISFSNEFESEFVQMKMEDYFEEYFIKYMLEYETQESLLNIEKFKTPFDYEIELENENKDMAKVDLVETFNYLMGINVEKLRVYNHQNRKYKIVIGKLNEQKVLVIWRNVVDLDMEEDKRFIEEEIIGENKFDKIYINYDNYVEGSLLIEEQFYKLMFEE